MLVEFDFVVTQTAYVKSAMDKIPAFRPDGLQPAAVQALVDSTTLIRSAYVTKKEGITGARALRHTTIDALHEGCVDFRAQGTSRFRKNPTVAARFERLPSKDETFQQTITRGTASEALWAVLPQVGTPPAAFTVGQGTTTLTLAGFTALIVSARGADAAIPVADQDFQGAEGDLHAKQAELEDFVTAALEQGRSQFGEGTPQRELIDAIPHTPSGGGTLPGQPFVTVDGLFTAVQTGHAESLGATGFRWLLKRTLESDYEVIGEGPANFIEMSGLSGADNFLKAIGINSAGEGDESEPVQFPGGI